MISLINSSALIATSVAVAAMTIRNIEERLKARLRVRAAENGRSMEEEARDILRSALASEPADKKDLGEAIRARFAKLGGVDLDLPEREPIREPFGVVR
jgi:plasmid stability protein